MTKSIKQWWKDIHTPSNEALEWFMFRTQVLEHPDLPDEHNTKGQCFVEGYRRGRHSMLIWIHVATVVSVVIGILVGHVSK